MKSLRAQLLIGTALTTAAVLLVSGAALHTLIARTMRAEFDESLIARARSLTALTELDGDTLEFELNEFSLPEFEPSDRAEYYQLWYPDQRIFTRSPSLGGSDLGPLADTPDEVALDALTLPDGRTGRLVRIRFQPRRESEDVSDDPSVLVTLAYARGDSELRAALVQVRNTLIGVCLAAVAISAGVLAWVVRRVMSPLDSISRQIGGIAEDDLSARIKPDGLPQELAPVVERLNDLLARLDAAFQRERRFTGDVAHELKTPLAGLRAKLELALSRDRAAESYRDTMGACLEINNQMQAVVDNLLNLARADAGQLEIRRGKVELDEIIRACWEPLAERATARGLTAAWQLEDVDPIESDRDLLRLVIHNVLDNAVAYTNDEGDIHVASSVDNGEVAVAIGNTGAKLAPGQIDHVFDRFWRADASCLDETQSHAGLGLPLCKAVVNCLGGTIGAETTPDGIFTIKIHLPRK